MLGHWEWIIILVIFLGVLVWELGRVRQAIRKAGDSPSPRPTTPSRDKP